MNELGMMMQVQIDDGWMHDEKLAPWLTNFYKEVIHFINLRIEEVGSARGEVIVVKIHYLWWWSINSLGRHTLN